MGILWEPSTGNLNELFWEWSMILPERLQVYNSGDDILTNREGEEVFIVGKIVMEIRAVKGL